MSGGTKGVTNMPDLEKFVKNVMYGGIGAAASLVEKGGDLARSLVEKGQETVRNSQDTADDIKRRLQEFCDGLMNRGEIDISKLTPEQRAELRHQLEEMDYQEIWGKETPEAADAPTTEAPETPEAPEAPVGHNSVIVEIMDINFIRMFLSEDKSSKKEEKSPPLQESFAGR